MPKINGIHISGVESVLYQKKTLSGNTQSGNISDLTFNNLEIGKTYRLSGNIRTGGNANQAEQDRQIVFNQGATLINITREVRGFDSQGVPGAMDTGISAIFTCTDTILQAVATCSTSFFIQANTFVILEELPNHEVTTDFT